MRRGRWWCAEAPGFLIWLGTLKIRLSEEGLFTRECSENELNSLLNAFGQTMCVECREIAEMTNKIRPEGFLRFSVYPLREAAIVPPTATDAPRLLIIRRTAVGDEAADTLLGNILKALKLDQDTACATLTPATTDYPHLPSLLTAVRATRCVVFGFTPQELGVRWQWPRYQPLTRAGKHYLFSEGLDKIGTDTTHKRSLWGGLQALMQLDH